MAVTPPDDQNALPAVPEAIERPPLRAGWFRFHFADERWEWSPEAAEIHGYVTGGLATVPSTALVMSHKHPDDRLRMEAHLDRVRRTHEAISTRHRIIDAQGRTVDLVVVGMELADNHGTVTGTTGFYIDVTPAALDPPSGDSARRHQLNINEAVDAVVETRSAIDQLKGMFMLIYGVDAESAFALLKWRSQDTNVKVRLLARQLVEEFHALADAEELPSRSAFDGVFLTAHLRVKNSAA
jgi:PAS domain S-box-containing protein